jgi:Domain of unknown function (DUF4124)
MALGLLAVLTAAPSVQAMVVYKWTDADGVIHFSDQPVEGAEKITTGSGTQSRGALSQRAPNVVAAAAKPKTTGALDYTQFSITSPSPDQTFTGDQAVTASLGLEPALKPDQTVSWSLNGVQVPNQPADAVSLSLTDLPRGSYTLSVTVTDPSSGQTRSADPVMFNVLRPSTLSPQHK